MKLKRFFASSIWAVPMLGLLIVPLLLSSVTIERYQIKKEVPIKKKGDEDK